MKEKTGEVFYQITFPLSPQDSKRFFSLSKKITTL
jgi:hypothetical protein